MTESLQRMQSFTGYNVRRAYTRFTRIFSKIGKRFDIKSQQSTILSCAALEPGIYPADIAQVHSMERSLVTALVNDLETKGLVERRGDGEDKRRKGLFITPAGEQFRHELMHVLRDEFEPEINQNLTSQEIEELNRLLVKMYSLDK